MNTDHIKCPLLFLIDLLENTIIMSIFVFGDGLDRQTRVRNTTNNPGRWNYLSVFFRTHWSNWGKWSTWDTRKNEVLKQIHYYLLLNQTSKLGSTKKIDLFVKLGSSKKMDLFVKEKKVFQPAAVSKESIFLSTCTIQLRFVTSSFTHVRNSLS